MAKTISAKARDDARGYTDADMAEVTDNPEWTAEMFAKAKPFAEVFPDLAVGTRRDVVPRTTPSKKAINLRLDQDVIDHYKSRGADWRFRMAEALRKGTGL